MRWLKEKVMEASIAELACAMVSTAATVVLLVMLVKLVTM